MANYTKGKWEAIRNLHGWHVECNGTGLAIHIDSEANAHLIAATPAMYEALKELMAGCLDNMGLAAGQLDGWQKAKQAIAQAEGKEQ